MAAVTRGGPDLGAILSGRRITACDGAMGTALQSAGLAPGECPERWNLDRAGAVEAVHRGHLEAGARILQTNSFGGNPARLALHGLESRCEEINRAAASIARRAAEGRALVFGSMGPTGQVLAPLGPLDRGVALDGFRRQAAALAEGGCDALIVETMTDLAEAILALEAASATGLSVLACMTFEITPRGIFTIYGDSPARAARELERAGAGAVGTNCGTGSAAMQGVVIALREATGLPIVARPNAGMPELTGGVPIYPESPETMAAGALALAAAGATIIGGCCGTTSAHVRAVARAIASHRARPRHEPDFPDLRPDPAGGPGRGEPR